MRWLVPFLFLIPLPLRACELALILAVDISGSVDSREFRIQMEGISAALRDSVVAEALVRDEAALALVQWTGASRQELSVPWTRITSFDALTELAARIEATPRAWINFSTAIGEALSFALPLFDGVPDCHRRVIDISGDGTSNEGEDPKGLHPALRDAGITVNALVIEGAEEDLVAYYWENVITGPSAFVVIADSYDDYARRMREKLLREVARVVSDRPRPDGATRIAKH